MSLLAFFSASSAAALASVALASSRSLPRIAVSASTVTRFGCTSRMPPATKTNSSLPSARLDAHRARLDARDQRRVARVDAELAGSRPAARRSAPRRRRSLFGADDVDVDGVGGVDHGHLAGGHASWPSRRLRRWCRPCRRPARAGGRIRRSTIILKPRMVSFSGTYLPGVPVNTSATWNGCDRKRWILRARATASLSSGDSSSMPRIAMMSRSSL